MNEVIYLLDWEPDDLSKINGSFRNKKMRDEVWECVHNGDSLAWRVISIVASFRGHQSEPVTLGGCCYKSLDQFKESDYYKDMCAEALRLLTSELEEAHNAYLAIKEIPMPSLDFVMYGSVDYLSNHHHGDREELISLSCLPTDEGDLRTMLVDALTHDLEKYPVELSVPEAQAIVADADASVVHGFAQIPAETLAEIYAAEDGYDCESLWFLLTW